MIDILGECETVGHNKIPHFSLLYDSNQRAIRQRKICEVKDRNVIEKLVFENENTCMLLHTSRVSIDDLFFSLLYRCSAENKRVLISLDCNPERRSSISDVGW